MAIKYNIAERGNPGAPDQPKKFYANAKADGEVTFRRVSKEIAQGSTTVSDTDVLAVLNDLNKVLVNHLSEGRIVRFGDFGSFQAVITSDGTESADKFNSALIRKAKIRFRPGIDLVEMLKNVKFEKMK
jgi:predicted histone-like DNA-binding protein